MPVQRTVRSSTAAPEQERGFNFGLGNLGKELWGIGAGLGRLALAPLPGGDPFGQVFSQAGKGIASSALGTVSTILPGSQALIKPLSRKMLGDEFEAQTLWEIANDPNRGLLPGLVENIGNLALGAGTVAGTTARVGSTASKIAAAERATYHAGRVGLSQGAIGAAKKFGEASVSRPTRGALKEAGLPSGMTQELTKVARTSQRARGLQAPPAAVAKARKRLDFGYGVAFPYRTASQRVARPLAEAGRARVLGPEKVAAAARAGTATPPPMSAAPALPDELAPPRVEQLSGIDAPAGTPPPKGPAELGLRLAALEGKTPEWATRVAAALPPGAAQRLSKLNGYYQKWDVSRVRSETRRFLQAEQRALFRSPAVTASRDAIDVLVREHNLSFEHADALVGDQLMAELGQTAMLHRLGLTPEILADAAEQGSALPGMIAEAGGSGGLLKRKIMEATGRKYEMTSEQLASVRPHLDTALDQWRLANEERSQRLLGGRLGEKGVEGLLDESPDLTIEMTPAQNRQFRQLEKEYKRLIKRDGPEKRALEAHAKARNAKVSELDRIKADMAVAKQAEADGRLRVVEEALPQSLRGAGRPAVAAALHQVIAANPEGFTFDFASGSLLGADEASASVGIMGRVIPAAEATPEGVLKFLEDHLPLLAHQDAKIGGWLADNGDFHLDVVQTTINGKRMTREEGVILGMSRGEQGIWDFEQALSRGGDGFASTAADADSMLIASHHVEDLFRQGSQFKRWLGQASTVREMLDAGQPAGSRIVREAHDERVAMNMRYATARLASGRIKSLDEHYGKLATDWQAAFDSNKSPLNAYFQMYLNPVFDPANTLDKALWDKAMRYMGPEGDQAVNWYYKAHADMAARYGDETVTLPRRMEDGSWGTREVKKTDLIFSLLAVTSKDRAPVLNAQLAFSGFLEAVDYGQASEWLDAISGGLDAYEATLRADLSAGRLGAGSAINSDPLFKALAAKVGHWADVRADVMDVITNRTISEWDNDYILTKVERTEIDRARRDAEVAYTKLKKKPADKAAYIEGRVAKVLERHAGLRSQFEGMPERAAMEHMGSDLFAKIRSFYENLADPSQEGVTLDRVMAELLGLPGGSWGTPGVYRQAAEQVRRLADEVSVSYFGEAGHVRPHQVQALLWVYTKKALNEIELGRRGSVLLDAVDALDDAEAWAIGGDPITRWLQQEMMTNAESAGIVTREVGVISPEAAAATLFGAPAMRADEAIHQQIPFNLKKDGSVDLAGPLGMLNEQLNRWQADSLPKIQEALAAGDRGVAEGVISSWMRKEMNRFLEDPEEYAMFFRGAEQKGVGPKGSDVLKRLRAKGLLPDPDMTRVRLLPETPEGGWDNAATMFRPEPVFQRMGTDVKGMTFMNQDERIVTRFFNTADATTLLHEDAHALRMLLPEDEIRVLETVYRKKVGTKGFEERFADDMLRHMSTQTPPPGLEAAFGRIRETLSMLWQGQGPNLLRNVDPDVGRILERYLEPDLRSPALGTPKIPTLETDFAGRTAGQIARSVQPDPGATPKQTLARGRRIGEAQAKVDDARLKTIKLAARERKAQRGLDRMAEIMNAADTPEGVRRARDLARTRAKIDRLVETADTPGTGSARTPAHWKPLYDSVAKLRQLAKTENLGVLADVLDEIPERFSEFLEYAMERGFDPTHVASLPEGMVARLVYGQLDVTGGVIESGTRKARTGSFPMTRSVEALMAAQLDVTREAANNGFVSFVEDTVAIPMAPGEIIPEGFQAWSPTNPFLKDAVDPAQAVRRTLTGQEGQQYMIPDQVANFMKRMDKTYDHWILGKVQKVTNPWRTFVLTLHPRWYVNNTIGNAVLATAHGARPQDWVKAWSAWKRGEGTALRAKLSQGIADQGAASPTGVQSLGTPLGPRETRAAGGTRRSAINAGHKKAIQSLGRANTVVDEVARSAVYNATRRAGFSDEVALQKALTAMVDYSDLGPLERTFVRAAIPFYSWQKGILKVATNLAIDNPLHTAVMMNFGRMQMDDYADMPDAYKHLIPLPFTSAGTALSVRAMNPFADAGSLTDPAGFANSLNPIIEAIVRNALDAPDTGYAEQYRVDDIGRAMPTTNVAESLGQTVASAVPLVGGHLAGFREGLDPGGAVGVRPLSEQRQGDIAERTRKSRRRAAGLSNAAPQRKKSPFAADLGALKPPKLTDFRATLGP